MKKNRKEKENTNQKRERESISVREINALAVGIQQCSLTLDRGHKAGV